MPKKNNPGCGCCGEGPTDPCDILVDDFNRPDSSSLGADWTEESGDWSIDSNELETQDATALALSVSGNPDGCTSYVSSKVKFSTTNDYARLIVAAADANNYLFAQLRISSPASLSIYQKSGGTETLIATYATSFFLSTGTQYSWYLCYSGSKLTTGVGAHNLTGSVSGFSGGKVGVGTGATVAGTINFDDFAATRVDEDCEDCPTYGKCDDCCASPAPFEVVVDFTGLAGTDELCENCLDIPVEYTLEDKTVGVGICRYSYTENYCPWPCGIADPNCADVYQLNVVLEIRPTLGLHPCTPFLRWSMGGLAGTDECSCPTGTADATYKGPDDSWVDSCAGPITLTKVSEGTGTADSACIMSFPDTITITRAA